jgi:hypothetical protein
MCDVPSTAVFCSESVECFPGTASKLLLLVAVVVSLTCAKHGRVTIPHAFNNDSDGKLVDHLLLNSTVN